MSPATLADDHARADQAWYGLDVDAAASAATARELLERALQQHDHRLEAAARVILVWRAGAQAGTQAEVLDDALAQARAAEAALQAADAQELRPRLHLARAMVQGALGDRAARFEDLEAARRSAAACADPYHEMLALHDLGLDFDQPELLEAALERARQLPEPGIGVVANLLHSVAPRLRAGDTATALARAEEAWQRVQQRPPDARWQVEALRILATTRARAGQRAAAQQALQALEPRLLPQRPALWWLTQGRVQAALGAAARAREAYARCLACDDRPRLLLDAAQELAPLLARARQWRQAYECQLRIDALRSRLLHDDNERRLRGLEVQHRLALREQQIEQERARHRELAEHLARLEAAHREITELSRRDALTGQFNRRHADAELARALTRVDRGDDRLVIALLDIDHFKSVNDRFGHATGDAVLKAVAAIVAAQLRTADLLARIGGEEFLLLLPGATPEAAAAAAERIRAAVQGHDWEALAPALAVTVSMGLGAAQVGEGADALLRRTDAELYRAKNAGRNRVCAAA